MKIIITKIKKKKINLKNLKIKVQDFLDLVLKVLVEDL